MNKKDDKLSAFIQANKSEVPPHNRASKERLLSNIDAAGSNSGGRTRLFLPAFISSCLLALVVYQIKESPQIGEQLSSSAQNTEQLETFLEESFSSYYSTFEDEPDTITF